MARYTRNYTRNEIEVRLTNEGISIIQVAALYHSYIGSSDTIEVIEASIAALQKIRDELKK